MRKIQDGNRACRVDCFLSVGECETKTGSAQCGAEHAAERLNGKETEGTEKAKWENRKQKDSL
ncbi:MAG TPA: hypothetical protein H9733_02935 [Candidatus Anaerotignum merdipullorum]|nr:hypothetical protein [Candidatus Anaerotignum merdipullorum]